MQPLLHDSLCPWLHQGVPVSRWSDLKPLCPARDTLACQGPPPGVYLARSCLHTVPASLMGAGLPHASGDGQAPPELSVPMRQAAGLRYGENPHQQAAFYTDQSLAEAGQGGIATATQHHGKEVTTKGSLLHWRCNSKFLGTGSLACLLANSWSCMGARQHFHVLPSHRADSRPHICTSLGRQFKAACSSKLDAPRCGLICSADNPRHLLLPADVVQQLPGR